MANGRIYVFCGISLCVIFVVHFIIQLSYHQSCPHLSQSAILPNTRPLSHDDCCSSAANLSQYKHRVTSAGFCRLPTRDGLRLALATMRTTTLSLVTLALASRAGEHQFWSVFSFTIRSCPRVLCLLMVCVWCLCFTRHLDPAAPSW